MNIPQYPKCPKKSKRNSVKEWEWSEETLLEGLKMGGLTGCMYYGCWDICKTNKGFSGKLMQYHLSDEFTEKDIKFALNKAKKWALGYRGLYFKRQY